MNNHATDERKLNQNIKIFTAWATILKLMFVTWITTLPRNTVKECSHKLMPTKNNYRAENRQSSWVSHIWRVALNRGITVINVSQTERQTHTHTVYCNRGRLSASGNFI